MPFLFQEKRLDKSLSELGLGDFKGASFTEEVLNIAKSKAAGEEDEYVATPQQQPESPPSPKITTNNLGISDFKGANFTNDIKDESLQSPDDDVSLEKVSQNQKNIKGTVSYAFEHKLRMVNSEHQNHY